MNRIWGHTLSTAILALAAGSAFPACAHNDGSLFVQGVLFPPVPAGGLCTYTAAPTSPTLPRGTVDGALTNAYAPEFLLGSALVSQGNPTTPQAETSTLTIQGADVRVVDPVDNSQWMNNDELAAGTIQPASGATPSYLAIATEIMNAGAIAHFLPAPSTYVQGVATVTQSKLAEVYVKFYGTTLGGDYIQSGEFLFPVDVCNGCLVSRPAAATAAYCAGTVASTSTAEACVLGQDQATDCQKCYDISLECR